MTAGFNICLDADRERELIELSRLQREGLTASTVMGAANLLAEMNRRGLKPTCAPDDGSDAGPWEPGSAPEIDGNDKRVLRATLTLTKEPA